MKKYKINYESDTIPSLPLQGWFLLFEANSLDEVMKRAKKTEGIKKITSVMELNEGSSRLIYVNCR